MEQANCGRESMNALSSFGLSTLERECWREEVRGGCSAAAGQARHCLETNEVIKW